VFCKFFHSLSALRLDEYMHVSMMFMIFTVIHTGVYGNVLRVKILFNKKDSALVEYSDPQHAFNGSITTWQIFCFS